MPRYKFRWSNLPISLLDELCHGLFEDASGLDACDVLQDAYGARPRDDFVAEAWDLLLEEWLHHDKPSRDQVVATLRELRHEDGRITNRRAQMEYLRELRNAKTLRSVVLQSFVEFGETERDEQEPQVDGDPAPPPTTPPETRKPDPPIRPPGDDVSTAVADSPVDLNVAPGSIVVVRDEEWLVTAAEQDTDGWLVRRSWAVRAGPRHDRHLLRQPRQDRGARPAAARVVADDSSGYRRVAALAGGDAAQDAGAATAIRRSRSRPHSSPTPLAYQQAAVDEGARPARTCGRGS